MKAVAATMPDSLVQSFRQEDAVDFVVLPKIKFAVISSRRDWDKHEPRMWSRASGLTDHELSDFVIENDLVQVRAGATAYGTIIFGKIRIPAINDSEGEGFIHVRSVSQVLLRDCLNLSVSILLLDQAYPDQSRAHGTEDVIFHSLFTEEGNRNADGQPTTWRAIQTRDTPLEYFDE
ncbi:hypothetical protein FRC10_006822 [Ceratobasidium sp. 414]|nr:hypothetical protein FRC10_006822 [Ceratobasidium sp. 414]